MKKSPTALPDVIMLEPIKHGDSRGFFLESYNSRDFESAIGIYATFVQDNHALSKKGVLRGLHYQLPPYAQGKLVRVTRGAIFDVAVDLRRSSPTFGQWTGEILSAENGRQMWIPEGFAHGYLALTDNAECLYKVTAFYAPEAERTIAWDDSAIGIAWPGELPPILSEKDRQGVSLGEAEIFG
ncbi:MAG: dTDP-4-dehydrorhamnose 3,5-epimerase [Oxalobacter sp.]|nr:dTDP-4-dehydrorhamnose 3,5-epimerase [Oxalobacter sp.]